MSQSEQYGFPPQNAAASLKRDSVRDTGRVRPGFPPQNAAASLKRYFGQIFFERESRFPPQNAAASLKPVHTFVEQSRRNGFSAAERGGLIEAT